MPLIENDCDHAVEERRRGERGEGGGQREREKVREEGGEREGEGGGVLKSMTIRN